MQRLSLLAASILFLTACGTPVATATIQPSPTPTRTPAPSPSPTLAPTFTPTATSTPFPTPIVRDAYINAELGLNLRLGPSLETDLIDTLSYGTHLTRFDPPTEPDADGYAWQNVQTDDGQSGWVVIEWLTDTQPDVLVFNPFTPFTIETLRERAYSQGPIEIVGTLQETAAFTRYVIAYPSDGLRVTAMMNIPLGGAPDERFPVIILNHGFVDPGRFPTGSYIRAEADYLARQGYLTFSPDYRGHSGGEGDPELAGPSVRGENSFRVEYAVDVLSLLHAIPTIPQADPTRIGMWGHSMGGGITLKVLSVDRGKQVDAAVLYGAMSGDETRNLRHIDKLWQPGIYDQVTAVFGTPEEKPEAYALISPLTYVADIAVPVGIHHGTLDDQVPIEWSQELAQQLEAAGKAVELFEYDKAGHSFSGETWTAFMQRVTAFFDQYVKAATE